MYTKMIDTLVITSIYRSEGEEPQTPTVATERKVSVTHYVEEWEDLTPPQQADALEQWRQDLDLCRLDREMLNWQIEGWGDRLGRPDLEWEPYGIDENHYGALIPGGLYTPDNAPVLPWQAVENALRAQYPPVEVPDVRDLALWLPVEDGDYWGLFGAYRKRWADYSKPGIYLTNGDSMPVELLARTGQYAYDTIAGELSGHVKAVERDAEAAYQEERSAENLALAIDAGNVTITIGEDGAVDL